VRQRLPVDGTFIFKLLDRRFVYHSDLHDGVGRALFWAAAEEYEAETLSVLLHLLQEAPANPTIFDVGANTGFYTLAVLAATPDAEVHAFEPVQHIARALSENVSANGFSRQVHIRACAVTEQSGHAALHIPDQTWGNATLSVDGFRGLEGHLEQVAAVALDDYASDRGLDHLDLLKIDVEGHEDAVLTGARRLMTEHRPAVLCECLPELNAAAFNDLIVGLGYEAYHLRASGPVHVPQVAADPTGRFKNFLLLPRERPRGDWLGTRHGTTP